MIKITYTYKVKETIHVDPNISEADLGKLEEEIRDYLSRSYHTTVELMGIDSEEFL